MRFVLIAIKIESCGRPENVYLNIWDSKMNDFDQLKMKTLFVNIFLIDCILLLNILSMFG